MKVFFLAPAEGKAQHDEHYKLITKTVEGLGYKIVMDAAQPTDAEFQKMPEAESAAYFKKMVNNLRQADVVFAEVTQESTLVGYLLSQAMSVEKPVVVFFHGKEEPALFSNLEKMNDRFQVVTYTSLDELKAEVPDALDFALSVQDTRFNFFIAPKHSLYLDWIAKKRKVSRSVYLRELIEQDIEKDGSGDVTS
jgi:hypothetical protein